MQLIHLTYEEIAALDACRETDALVAEHVMDGQEWEQGYVPYLHCRSYSTDASATYIMEEHLVRDDPKIGYDYALQLLQEIDPQGEVESPAWLAWRAAHAAPLQRSRAALRTVRYLQEREEGADDQ